LGRFLGREWHGEEVQRPLVRASLDAAHQLACDRCRLTACGACCAYVQLVVTDGHRVRRITTSSFDTSQVQGIWSFNRVVTLAGGLETGFTDGIGEIATFNGPTVRPTAALTLFSVVGYVQCWLSFWQGVAVAPDGRIYVTEGSNCRVRRITPADVLAQNLQCSTRLVDVLRPGGCALYDPPVTVHDRMVSTLQLSSFHVTTCPLLT
jgi:hypothetical protein